MKISKEVGLILRYVFLLALGLFNLKLFYFILTPLTSYLVYFLLSLTTNSVSVLETNLIVFKNTLVELIPACIAASAYYLLLILNLSTPMKTDKRIKNIVFVLGIFLAVNVVRIVLFIYLAVGGYTYFDEAHLATWYVGSTLAVIAIWFFGVKRFKIKDIPVYTDAKMLFKFTVVKDISLSLNVKIF